MPVANVPEPPATPTTAVALGDVRCSHCGWTCAVRPPHYVPTPRPSSTTRFAIKCFGVSRDERCRRVRVFSYLQDGGGDPRLSEVPPMLPGYVFIQEMLRYGGSRQKIAKLLVDACDLHMLGLLEANPESRDAAFAASALHLRRAAEFFLRRIILHEKRKWRWAGKLVNDLRNSHPRTLRADARPKQLATRLRFIFDTGDVAAHEEIFPRGWRKYKRPATDTSIRICLSNFEEVANKVKWK